MMENQYDFLKEKLLRQDIADILPIYFRAFVARKKYGAQYHNLLAVLAKMMRTYQETEGFPDHLPVFLLRDNPDGTENWLGWMKIQMEKLDSSMTMEEALNYTEENKESWSDEEIQFINYILGEQ